METPCFSLKHGTGQFSACSLDAYLFRWYVTHFYFKSSMQTFRGPERTGVSHDGTFLISRRQYPSCDNAYGRHLRSAGLAYIFYILSPLQTWMSTLSSSGDLHSQASGLMHRRPTVRPTLDIAGGTRLPLAVPWSIFTTLARVAIP